MSQDIDTDSLEEGIAKYGLFIMKLDQAISKFPPTEVNHAGRTALMDLRTMMDGQKRALRDELRRYNIPDS